MGGVKGRRLGLGYRSWRDGLCGEVVRGERPYDPLSETGENRLLCALA
jgi:hypothetical protein